MLQVLLLHSYDDRRFGPQFLQLVIVAHFRAEEVNDHASVIEQYPAGSGCPLDAQWAHRLHFELFLNFIRDRFQLPLALRRPDHEIIGDERYGACVEHENIFAFFVGDNVNDNSREVAWFQSLSSPGYLGK